MSGKKMGRPVVMPDGENDIARLRRERGWSQKQAAEALGITPAQVSKIERGIHPIVGAVKKMVDILMPNKT